MRGRPPELRTLERWGLLRERRLQRIHGHHVLRIIGQVLIEIRQRVGVLGERVVKDAVLVAVLLALDGTRECWSDAMLLLLPW